MKKDAIVNLENKSVTVSKLPLGKYAEVFMALEELPKQIGGLDSFSNEEVLQRIPFIIGKALPEIAKIISIATDLTEEEVLESGLDEVLELIAAILEVNNIQGVVESAKKIMARKPGPESTGSTGQSTSSPVNTTGPNPKS